MRTSGGRRKAITAAAITGLVVASIGTATTSQAAPKETRKPTATTSAAAAKPVAKPSSKTKKNSKVVYLTFDDGPSPKYTPQVLNLLKQHNAKATFFVLGGNAKNNPSLIKQIRAGGHAIGNHTYTHPWLTKIAPNRIANELTSTDAAIGSRTSCMRPPGGFVNQTVRNAVAKQGKKVVMWTVDASDWSRPGVNTIVNRVMKNTRNGSIVLMHDGGGPRSQSVAALGQVLPKLAKAGYRFETLPQCR
ncbi:Probable polysaccharide deacetylase pdaA precursor [Dermatophilus congolensis]|uniref:Probable polysaccharide deacetylase pdaA n=1 Tax=Dermatophilus congolensis TaxID=1863 RepID=A0A239V9H3_9MICO|nr:polysaccharide deacetylase family protein [Dermatophilus congolensis]SNV18064.1 Probable polysaccharide deacetylase pdaA precursor [Dermatophilus congolensis]